MFVFSFRRRQCVATTRPETAFCFEVLYIQQHVFFVTPPPARSEMPSLRAMLLPRGRTKLTPDTTLCGELRGALQNQRSGSLLRRPGGRRAKHTSVSWSISYHSSLFEMRPPRACPLLWIGRASYSRPQVLHLKLLLYSHVGEASVPFGLFLLGNVH